MEIEKVIIDTLRNTRDSYLCINSLGSAIILIRDPTEEDGFRSISGVAGGPFSEEEFQPLILCGTLVRADLVEPDCHGFYVLSEAV